MMDRRSFLHWSSTAMLAPWLELSASAQTSQPRESGFDPWIEIRGDHPAGSGSAHASVSC